MAFNTQDWWVTGAGHTGEAPITVGTIHGEAWEHSIAGGNITPAKKYGGVRIGFRRPIDRWVIKRTITWMVGLCDGNVFSQVKSVAPDGTPVLSAPTHMNPSGPRVAANPVDNHVLAIGGNIVVITHDGQVFAHRLSDTAIGPGKPVPGARVAFRTADRWVVAGQARPGAEHEIFVITSNGEVWANTVHMSGGDIQEIGQSHRLAGPGVGFRAQDRWVVLSGGKFVVITENGEAWVNDILE
ncbi:MULTISPECIES: hypothetical protein [Streptomyces]|uniref:hypothetical protein n=1 Tax=Streptomyces TaxID=1883 RepID=UPI001367E40E|nr:hypothetical protein [Streptomyces sp. EAS-AB2608]MYU29588.1 hypothetical protein [Streptomyces sp. SID7810]